MAPPAAESIEDEIKNEKNPRPLDEDDIALLKTYVYSSLSPLSIYFSTYNNYYCYVSILAFWILRPLGLSYFRSIFLISPLCCFVDWFFLIYLYVCCLLLLARGYINKWNGIVFFTCLLIVWLKSSSWLYLVNQYRIQGKHYLIQQSVLFRMVKYVFGFDLLF